VIESRWEDATSEAGAGDIRFRAWGERADDLIEQLLRTLETLQVGQPPEIKRFRNAKLDIKAGAGVSSHGTVEAGASTLEIPSKPELPPKYTPEIFVSYAWGDDSSDDARKRGEVVDRLCETLDKDGWNTIRDTKGLRPGELISGFLKRIARADQLIVVLSDKYLRSRYCMTELYDIYRRSIGAEDEFQSRVNPLVLNDVRIDKILSVFPVIFMNKLRPLSFCYQAAAVSPRST
jgi:TIR domain-containing protein